MAHSISSKLILCVLLVTWATCVLTEEMLDTNDDDVDVKAEETKNRYRAINVNVLGFTSEQKEEIVRKHNELRAQQRSSDMLEMKWSTRLERIAKTWSRNCEFEHNPDRSVGSGFPYAGENIYATGKVTFEPAEIVQAWYSEIESYDTRAQKCASGKICGHYTQIVWAKSGYIGCGVTFCSNIFKLGGYFIVCNYGPGGNISDQKPFTIGAACSNCPEDAPDCVNGLCVKK